MTLSKNKLWKLLLSAMRCINRDFTDHGERVAYSMLRLCRAKKLDEDKTLCMVFLALYHEIGAFKSEDASGLLQFEAENTYGHCLEGYLFLKYFSPIGDGALPILYHHVLYDPADTRQEVYDGMMIHLCDRFDVLYLKDLPKRELCRTVCQNSGSMFEPDMTEIFCKLLHEGGLYEAFEDGTYRTELSVYFDEVELPSNFAFGTLNMLVYTFEAVSPNTVIHSALTASYAYLLGEEMGLERDTCNELYLAGMVHDIGKIRTPVDILEKPARLSQDETSVMRRHPADSSELLATCFDDAFVRTASRHHERPNGTGYPERLSGEALNMPERIMAVADIISALYTKRSYKDVFDAETVRKIMVDMAEKENIDAQITATYLSNAERLDARAQEYIAPVREKYALMSAEYESLKDRAIGY